LTCAFIASLRLGSPRGTRVDGRRCRRNRTPSLAVAPTVAAPLGEPTDYKPWRGAGHVWPVQRGGAGTGAGGRRRAFAALQKRFTSVGVKIGRASGREGRGIGVGAPWVRKKGDETD